MAPQPHNPSAGPPRHASVEGCRRFPVLFISLACLLCFSVSTARAAPDTPQLSTNTDTATAGFYTLSWTASSAVVELQQSSDENFSDITALYNGPDHAIHISGRGDGTWFYRVRTSNGAGAGDWSNTVSVTVKHHSLSRALTFFAIGAVVFLSIVVFLFVNRERNDGD